MNTKTVVSTDTGARVTPGVQSIRIGDLPAAAPDYNAVVFGDFLRDMKGTKSSREFAYETDLSESFVSKAVNGLQKSRPSKRTLLKLLRAKTEEPVDWRKLARAAGYGDLELEAEPITEANDTQNVKELSAAAVITKYYGEDHFTAMGEMLKALSEHGLEGDVTSCFYRDAGYFEVIDQKTGRVYVGVNAYIKPAEEDNGQGLSETDKEYEPVVAIAFSAALTYTRIMASENVEEKAVYFLTDDERVYRALRNNLPKQRTKATVVVLTEDHQGFCKEEVLNGSERDLISLVD